ncbi:ABC transporter ATP-binding protein [Streptomyces cavernae]|uniref:ABC transporter ATP-binding protein n=1 Tax=Streptomyces cavernae TaxID=2259034 RepID=UPI000FEBBD98|nr:ABC transporter ATP-binding protein [Streptomyces cavernae]
MSLLSIESLEVRHGLLRAVREVSFTVDEGEVVAMVGANGAGKSTLMRAVAGAHRPADGRIRLDGVDVTARRAHDRVAAGIALVPEGRRLFADLTVEENLLVASRVKRSGPWDLAAVLAAFPLLDGLLKRRAGNLSGGEQQAVAIGRALMTNPRLLLLDEVSLGLAPIVVDTLYQSLGTILSGGTTVLLVEQDLGRALGVSRRVLCMLEGRVVLDESADAVTREQVVDAYFGLSRAKGGGAANPATAVPEESEREPA